LLEDRKNKTNQRRWNNAGTRLDPGLKTVEAISFNTQADKAPRNPIWTTVGLVEDSNTDEVVDWLSKAKAQGWLPRLVAETD
jgi:hypothetical protein